MTTTGIRFFALALFVVQCVSLSTPGNGHAETPLAAGRKALLFQVSSDIRLSAFEGTTISLKKHTSPSNAWRFGLTASGSTVDDETDELYEPEAPPLDFHRDQQTDNVSIALSLEKLKYISPDGPLTLFYGVGPGVSGSWADLETRERRDTVAIVRTSKTQTYGVGIGLAIGIEWFVHQRIGLIGQYATDVSYRWSRSEQFDSRYYYGGSQRRETDTSRLELRAKEVRLGVSAYW